MHKARVEQKFRHKVLQHNYRALNSILCKLFFLKLDAASSSLGLACVYEVVACVLLSFFTLTPIANKNIISLEVKAPVLFFVLPHDRSGKHFTSCIRCAIAKGLAYLLIGTLTINLYPTRMSTRTFLPFHKSYPLRLHRIKQLQSNPWFVASFGTHVGCLVALNKFTKRVVTVMEVFWCTSPTNHIERF